VSADLPLDRLDRLVLEGWARRRGGAPVIVDGDVRLTAPEATALVVEATAFLSHLVGSAASPAAAGQPGPVVAVQATNRWEVMALAVAAWGAGATVLLVPARAGRAALAHALEATGPVAVVSEEGLPAADHPEALVLGDRSAMGWPQWLAGPTPSGAAPDPHRGRAGVAVILPTGGSTGPPKLVPHTHAALARKATQMVDVHGLGPDDVVLMPAPLGHMSGLLNGILVPAAAGMATVLMPAWAPDRAVRLCRRDGVSFMVGPPAFFTTLADASTPTPGPAPSLRVISCGGAGVTEGFVEWARATFGADVKRSYGSTEAPTITSAWPGDAGDRKARTDGRVIDPDTEIRVDPLSGELQVRGPEVTHGYLDAGRWRTACTEDGWFRTGDRAHIDDGWLVVDGRLDDMIIRGGENIVAAEVERLLEQHPDVRQAVVVAEPHATLGQRVCAFVVSDPHFDIDVCRRHFADQGASRIATPERIVVVSVIPTLSTGKADRLSLARRAAEMAIDG